jgi:hypothetical protein
MQTAVMGTKYRSGFHFIFDLRMNLKMIVKNPWADPYLGDMLDEQGWPDEAQYRYEQALAVDSQPVNTLRCIGDLQNGHGRRDEAREYYDRSTWTRCATSASCTTSTGGRTNC